MDYEIRPGPGRERDDEPGPTGNFPRGKINEHDEGELKLRISRAPTGEVLIDFGKTVAWLALPPKDCVDFALLLLARAGVHATTIGTMRLMLRDEVP